MFTHRKNIDNAWFVCSLNKEEVAKVETIAVTRGIKTLLRINKLAAENNLKLSETDRAAILVFSAVTMESFASDLIDAKNAASKAASNKTAEQTTAELPAEEQPPF